MWVLKVVRTGQTDTWPGQKWIEQMTDMWHGTNARVTESDAHFLGFHSVLTNLVVFEMGF